MLTNDKLSLDFNVKFKNFVYACSDKKIDGPSFYEETLASRCIYLNIFKDHLHVQICPAFFNVEDNPDPSKRIKLQFHVHSHLAK